MSSNLGTGKISQKSLGINFLEDLKNFNKVISLQRDKIINDRFLRDATIVTAYAINIGNN